MGVRFPNGTSAFAQTCRRRRSPVVGSDQRLVYALDAAAVARNGALQEQAGLRTEISIGSSHDRGSEIREFISAT